MPNLGRMKKLLTTYLVVLHYQMLHELTKILICIISMSVSDQFIGEKIILKKL